MKARIRLLAIAWLSISIVLRLYGSNGGDAAIVGGLLFLLWTAPFGMIWQFYLYDYATMLMPARIAQVIGDGVVILVAMLFWFVFVPRWCRLRERRSQS